MINRILTCIKVLQIVYLYYQSRSGDLKVMENGLLFSSQKSHNLYYYFLPLIIEVINLQRKILGTRKCKRMPAGEELNLNTRFIDNRFVTQLTENDTSKKCVDKQGLSWSNDEEFIKDVLDITLSSEIYAEYLKNEKDSYETDHEFWRQIFKRIICGDEVIEEHLEDKNIYWNDDIETVKTFALKAIKEFEERKGSKQALLSMFRDLEDKAFTIKSFRQSSLRGKEYRGCIDKHMKNWETERITSMGLIIMQVALAKTLLSPTIPINVILDEYIDATGYYSTPKSGIFINGILDSTVNELEKEKLLLKDQLLSLHLCISSSILTYKAIIII